MKKDEPIEIYVHIPFCVKKCNYCDFLSYPADERIKDKYVDALCNQIGIVGAHILPGQNYPEDENTSEDFFFDEDDYEASFLHEANHDDSEKMKVSTVYFGGGTPTCLSTGQLERILCKLKEKFDFLPDTEVTIEVNPGTVSDYDLEYLCKMGFNRISIGLQSANEDELRALGRIHTYEDFVYCYKNARKAGFNNINVDVMTALPNQTQEKLLNTLNKVIKLSPEHISAYSLIIEEDTPFYELYGDIEGPVVGEKTERSLYYLMRDTLAAAGYLRYEISNFAKPGYESRHNTGYWKRIPYIGFGLGASSFYDNIRVSITESVSEYIKDPMTAASVQKLSQTDAMEEFMFLGLRMQKGVDKNDFKMQFGRTAEDVFGRAITRLMEEGLLVSSDGRYYLTDKGIDYGNYAFSQFLM